MDSGLFHPLGVLCTPLPFTVWGVHRVSLWGVPCAPLSLKTEDSKIAPLWSPVPLWYHLNLTPTLFFYYLVNITQYPVKTPTKTPTTKQIINMSRPATFQLNFLE
jgi:hypothetical protein